MGSISQSAVSARIEACVHRWDIANIPVEGQFGGRTGRVYPARCMNPGCGATTSFPVWPGAFKSSVMKGTRYASLNKDEAVLPKAHANGSPQNMNVLVGKVGRPPDLETARYYEEHKEQILADMQQLGKIQGLKKWKIPDSRWRVLKRKWNVPNGKGTRSEKDLLAVVAPVHNGNGNGHGNGNGNNGNGSPQASVRGVGWSGSDVHSALQEAIAVMHVAGRGRQNGPSHGNGLNQAGPARAVQGVLAEELHTGTLDGKMSHVRLAQLLYRLADAAGQTELGTGLKLAATLAEMA